MRFARPTLPHLLLSAFTAAAGATVALGLRSALAAVLSIVSVMGAVVEIPLPGSIMTGATRLARMGSAISVAGGVLLSLYPALPQRLILEVTSVAGNGLLLCAGLLLVGRTPPWAGLLPATLGALIAAFLQPEPRGLRVAAGLAAALLVAWLAANDDDRATTRSVRLLPLSIFVSLAAAIAVGIAILLPWAQPQVEVIALRMISNDMEAATGLATESRLGDVERLGQSKRIALRFYADRAADLRVRTFALFDGQAWKVDPRPGRPLAPLEVPPGRFPHLDETQGVTLAAPAATLGAGLVSARIVARSAERGAMPAPANTMAVKVEDTSVEQNPSGILLPNAAAALYAVVFADADAGEAPPGPEMLKLPEHVDPRLRELAVSLSGAGLPATLRIDRVVGHFQAGYHYTLEVGKFQTADPVAEFVYEKKKGYCEYFATAATLLLRLSGVPARYVTGYAVRSFQRNGTHYVVRDSDAHAWAEAYVAGRGWVEVDATPSGDYQAVHGHPDNAGFLARAGVFYDEAAALYAQSGVPGLQGGLERAVVSHSVPAGMVIAAFMAFRFRRRLRWRRGRKRNAPAAVIPDSWSRETRTLLLGVDAVCASRGKPRPPHRAPREHVVDPGISLTEEERSACLRAVDLLYSQAYGDRAATPRDLAEVTAGLIALGARRSASP